MSDQPLFVPGGVVQLVLVRWYPNFTQQPGGLRMSYM
jgi:hypothetical protein